MSGQEMDVKVISDAMWEKLLRLVGAKGVARRDKRFMDLYEALKKMRDGGTLVVSLSGGKWGLRPEIGVGKWRDLEAYNRGRDKHLRPYHQELVECLGELAEREREQGAGGDGKGDGVRLFASEEQAGKVREALDRKGYCAVRSGVLDGEIVYFAKTAVDAEVVGKRYPEGVCFTLKELAWLLDNGDLTEDQVRQVYRSKRAIKGTIVGSGEPVGVFGD